MISIVLLVVGVLAARPQPAFSYAWDWPWTERCHDLGDEPRLLGDQAAYRQLGQDATDLKQFKVSAATRVIHGCGGPLRSLDGIEMATNLECLDVARTKVTDLSRLGSLPHLKVLRAKGLSWKSMEKAPLPGSLRYLEVTLEGTAARLQVPDAVETLVIEAAKLRKLPELQGGRNLKTLICVRCGLTDVSSLRSNKAVNTLVLPFNMLGDLGDIGRLAQLEVLSIEGNFPLKKLAPLQNLRKLRVLAFGGGGHHIEDADVIREMPGLRHVEAPGIRDTRLKDYIKQRLRKPAEIPPLLGAGAWSDHCQKYERSDNEKAADVRYQQERRRLDTCVQRLDQKSCAHIDLDMLWVLEGDGVISKSKARKIESLVKRPASEDQPEELEP